MLKFSIEAEGRIATALPLDDLLAMSDHIKLVYARLDRAMEHIEALDKCLTDYVQRDGYDIVGSSEDESQGLFKYTFTFKLNREVPTLATLIFSDAIHQLRSACDNLIFATGELYNVKKLESLHYPAFLDSGMSQLTKESNSFLNWTEKHKGFPRDIVDLIDSTQPYNLFEAPRRQVTKNEHPLFLLSKLSNIDKHRLPTIVLMRRASHGFFLKSREHIHDFREARVRLSDVLEDGVRLLSFTASNAYLPDDFELPLSVNFVLDPRSKIAGGWSVVPLLNFIHDFVRNVVVSSFELKSGLDQPPNPPQV